MIDLDFIRVCRLDELPSVGAARANLDGRIVSIVRAEDGSVHCIDDECTHGRVSLSEGDVSGCTVECWLHGSRFDLRTGHPLSPPATEPVVVHSVKIEGDEVFVALAEEN
ncbi:Rieske 2Fe-2S domain-containing protein [Nostocoides sp. F2B08]|uniref:non-heme iron oxygenase ferredoxin subunit n=1 Tax=Nostocoides sp. F2B08 TaxID=2653936 RepID=UPI0012635549|nr:non-heme iron oxygenase ferredoxin subunit [Tetrasphaera sp. F2B08]KAB7744526.1 Rieske 2Fe-2S domain-containing protein [Tetrasphaera sp. F2B08]